MKISTNIYTIVRAFDGLVWHWFVCVTSILSVRTSIFVCKDFDFLFVWLQLAWSFNLPEAELPNFQEFIYFIGPGTTHWFMSLQEFIF